MQQDMASKQGISLDEVDELIEKSTKNNIIVTYSYLKDRQKNEETFNKMMNIKPKERELNDKDDAALFVTPRLVSREAKYKGMDPA